MQDVTTNPVCTATLALKIRFCTIALSADQFQGKIKFYPKTNSVESNCERRTVYAKIGINEAVEDIEMTYEEWMLGCKARSVGSDEEVTFYISRGYHPNTLIVFRPFMGGNMYFSHAGLSRVSLIIGTGIISLVTLLPNEDEHEL